MQELDAKIARAIHDLNEGRLVAERQRKLMAEGRGVPNAAELLKAFEKSLEILEAGLSRLVAERAATVLQAERPAHARGEIENGTDAHIRRRTLPQHPGRSPPPRVDAIQRHVDVCPTGPHQPHGSPARKAGGSASLR